MGDFLKALDHVLALRHPVSAWMRTHESMGTWFSGLAALVASGAALTFSLRQSHQQRQSEARQRDAAEKERNLEAAMLASALLQPTVNLRLEIYRVSLEFEATGSSYMFNGQALEAPVIIHSPLLNVPRVLIERQSEYKLLRDLHGNDLTYVVALCQLYDEQMARAGAEHSRSLAIRGDSEEFRKYRSWLEFARNKLPSIIENLQKQSGLPADSVLVVQHPMRKAELLDSDIDVNPNADHSTPTSNT